MIKRREWMKTAGFATLSLGTALLHKGPGERSNPNPRRT